MLICIKRVTSVSVIVLIPSGWSWCKYMENSCWRFSRERNVHMQMYKWMQRLVSLGVVVAEDRFCALDWEHWQWKLFSLSKRTCRSFSGVWKLFVTVRMTKDFSDTRWMIAEWERAISFSVCCTLVGNGKVDSVSTFNSSGSDCELLCIATLMWEQGGWWLSECKDHYTP